MVHVTFVWALSAAKFIWKATKVGHGSNIDWVVIFWLCLSIALFTTVGFAFASHTGGSRPALAGAEEAGGGQ